MKRLILFLIVGPLIPTLSLSADLIRKPLRDVPLDLKTVQSAETRKYRWVSITQEGSKTETNDYARLVTSTEFDNEKLQLHDTITLTPSHNGMIFDRRISYSNGKLFTPERITLDISGPQNTVRQLSYEKGAATIVEFSGSTNTQRWTFDNDVLTFNLLLRLAPLLPKETGRVYTFEKYAEPFLFRLQEAKKKDDPFTLACEASETVMIGKKSHQCVRFRLELKSAEVTTDIWVAKDNVVVKLRDMLSERADAKFLEATLQEE